MFESLRTARISSFALVALTCMLLLGGGAVRAAESHGTLVADDGADIYDWELDFLLDLFIGNNYHSRILAFTECYGGDKVDDFDGDPRTTILSGSEPGNTTIYGGYHRGLAQGLAPGTTTDAAHQSGVDNKKKGDTPTKSGPNTDIGTGGDGGNIQSTHVLVWAGDPNAQDQADINDIHGNFNGQPNTTVTVLSGDGTGANVDGAATFDELVDALDTIGSMMNANEQFILFVTDHGDLDSSASDVTCTAGETCEIELEIPLSLYTDMLNDPGNEPYIALFSEIPIVPGQMELALNFLPPQDVGSAFVQTPLDFNNDTVPEMFEYQLFLTDADLQPGFNLVTILPVVDVFLPFVSLDSGAIQRLDSFVPTVEPGMDLFETPANGTTFQEFPPSAPLPPGLFSQGDDGNPCGPTPTSLSDPFFGVIVLGGQPLNTDPPGVLGVTDTIIRRLEPANFPDCPVADTIPIEIVALSLESVQPITVTYDGGLDPQLWDVHVCLSDIPSPPGQMTIVQQHPNGGVFDSFLPVQPKFVFTKLSDPACVVTLDTGLFELPPIEFQTLNGHWLDHAPPHLGLVQDPFGGIQVDGNCDGLPDPLPLPPTTNFVPGVRLPFCPGDNCDLPFAEPVKRLTEEEALLARHGVLPAEEPTPDLDLDGVPDLGDNCGGVAPQPPDYLIPNPLQEDADDDGHGDACDDCPLDCDPFQLDSDEDGIGDACDCAPGLPGNPIPGEALDLLFLDKVQLIWTPAPDATSHQMLRGAIAELPAGSGSPNELCFDGLGATFVDTDPPAPGAGFWYLARGRNDCGAGSYGLQNPPLLRSSPTCP